MGARVSFSNTGAGGSSYPRSTPFEERQAPGGAERGGAARTSVATFILPIEDCLVPPATELGGGGKDGSLARYRAVTFREFMRVYKTVSTRRESIEKAFKI